MLIETKSAATHEIEVPDDTVEASRPQRSHRARRYRPRRTLSDRVRDALMVMAEGQAQVLTHQEKPWASITFSGSRHELVLSFDGISACKIGEQFVADLPDHEFAIPGQLVADATITSVESNYTPDPRMAVTAVLLLLEDV